MKKSLALTSVLILMLCAVYVSAQAQNPVPQPVRAPITSVTEADDLSRRSAEINNPNPAQLKWYIRYEPGRYPTLLPFDISKNAAAKIKVGKSERAAFRNETKNDLNILKVFSAPSCADAGKCAEIADLIKVSHYSFLWQRHGENNGDFQIVEDDLIAGNGSYVHGMLVNLGEIETLEIDKKTPAVESLASFPIALNFEDEAEQRQKLQAGIGYRDLQISSSRKLVKNHVYVMRLISYGFEDEIQSIYSKDSIFLFKVGQLNDDKMTFILWKKLSEKYAPRLKIK